MNKQKVDLQVHRKITYGTQGGLVETLNFTWPRPRIRIGVSSPAEKLAILPIYPRLFSEEVTIGKTIVQPHVRTIRSKLQSLVRAESEFERTSLAVSPPGDVEPGDRATFALSSMSPL